MVAIASNGTGGGDWSAGASWTGGIAPVAGDTVTIAATDTISVNTTGCAALTLTLNGIITWTAGATTGITFGDGTSDTIITFGAGGLWRAGTTATPLTGLHTVTLSPLSTSLASVANNFNMAACNTLTSGMTIVCDRTVYGVAESYTHPITAVVYPTRRNYTLVSTQVNTLQADAVLSENLKLRAGGGDILTFPSSTAANGIPNVAQIKTTASYNAGTRTATCTANFTTQVTLNTLAGVPAMGARAYSEASVFTMTANVNTKYWGYTGSASANAQFELQNATLRWFAGNSSTFVQLNSRTIQGCVLIGTAAAVTGNGFRHAGAASQYVSCIIDAFPNQNFGPQFYYNCMFTAVVRQSFDFINVMGASDFIDCAFQDCVQAPVNSTGCSLIRCSALQCSSAAGACGIVTDCSFHRLNVLAWSGAMLRPFFGAMTILGTANIFNMFVESATFLGTIGTIGADVNSRTASNRSGFIFGLQGGSGAFAPSTIGLKSAPGGNVTAYSAPPDVIAVPPSGATVYNRLVTTAAIAPTFIGETFRAALSNYQFIAVSGTTYSFTVPILSVSGYTASSLTSIRLILTWTDGTSVTTTVSALTANTWNLTNVAGVCPSSGACTVQTYIQANIGSVYIDYPLDCDPAGYRWTGGQPQVSQTRLQDSSAGTVAAAVVARGNDIADQVWRRTTSGIEGSAYGDAISLKSPYGMVAQGIHNTQVVANTLTVTRSDDTTVLGIRTTTTNAIAEPITGIDSN